MQHFGASKMGRWYMEAHSHVLMFTNCLLFIWPVSLTSTSRTISSTSRLRTGNPNALNTICGRASFIYSWHRKDGGRLQTGRTCIKNHFYFYSHTNLKFMIIYESRTICIKQVEGLFYLFLLCCRKRRHSALHTFQMERCFFFSCYKIPFARKRTHSALPFCAGAPYRAIAILLWP